MHSAATVTTRLLNSKQNRFNCANTRIWSQVTYDFLYTLLSSGFTFASMYQDVNNLFGKANVDLKAGELELSYTAFGFGIFAGLVLAVAEAFCHKAEGEFFNERSAAHPSSNDSKNPNSKAIVEQSDSAVRSEDKEDELPPLTSPQKALARIHYFSDISNGVALPIGLSKLTGFSQSLTLLKGGLAYGGVAIFCAIGNWQRFFNTKKAIREANQRDLDLQQKMGVKSGLGSVVV